MVLHVGEDFDSVDDAVDLINQLPAVDDVYSPVFAKTVVLQSDKDYDIDELLTQFSNRDFAVYRIAPSSNSSTLPAGPYFLSQGQIHQAYRLYEDVLDSFIFGVLPEDVLNPTKYFHPAMLSVSRNSLTNRDTSSSHLSV